MAEPELKSQSRRGWLPIETNAFDRVFIGLVVFVALHLFWMRFLESHLPLNVATAASLIIGYFIVRWG